MRKRLRIAIGLLLGGSLGWIIWQGSGPSEPVFEGRGLSGWLDHHVASTAAKPPYNSPGWRKADEALRAIGTNAIPTLLRIVAAKDPPVLVQKLLQTAGRYPWTHVTYRPSSWRHEEAEYAFQMLGASGASAVPGLIRIYEADISPSSQRTAALALGHIGSAAQAALPALIRNFDHPNADVRFYAVSAVMSIGGEPDVVLPALTTALKDPDIRIRWNALVGVSEFGSRARPAAAEVLKLLNDEGAIGGSPIREQVETALWRIAPEKVGKPLVVEESTPMVVAGTTVQDLKLPFLGERKTLIPTGRSVPAVAQYWNSDPRPKLALYRGASGSTEGDHFLGEFEVLDLPPSEDLNVSTLCVIADGRLLLCARDNDRNRFLEIRRVEPDAAR